MDPIQARKMLLDELLIGKFEGNDLVVYDPPSKAFFLWGGGKHVEVVVVDDETTEVQAPHVFEIDPQHEDAVPMGWIGTCIATWRERQGIPPV